MVRPRAVILFAITVFATGAFALSLPSNQTVQATGPGGAIVTYSASGNGAEDENGRPTTAVNCSPASGSQFHIGTTTVTCTSANESGTFTVNVVDTIGPTLALPNGISVPGPSTGTAVTYNASATDTVDGSVPVSCSPASGSVFPRGTTTVTCNATDSHQNTSTGTFTVTVYEPATTPPPAPKLPGDITAEAMGPDGAVVTYSASGGGPDDENGRPTGSANCSPASGSKFPLGETTVQCDGGSFRVRVVDTTAPALSIPRDFSIAGTSSGATVTYNAAASDLVDGGVAVSCSPASGTNFPVGTTTVVCSATDAHANTASGSFAVTVTAQQPPDPPPALSDITREATGPNGAVVNFTVSGTGGPDDENGRPINSANCSPASGSTFPLGETTVQCGSAGSFKVTIVDTTAPALFLPGNITSSDPVVTYTASAQDLVDGSVGVTCTPPSGSTFATGTTVVNCTASDARGNTASGSFTVTVNSQPADTEAPTIVSITASPNVITPPNNSLVEVMLTVDVIDNVDTMPYVNIYDVTSNEMLTSGDWNRTGPLIVQLRAERDPKGQGRIYTIHVEAIDAAGNRSSSAVNVTVPHDSSGSTAPSTTQPTTTTRRRSSRG